MADALFVGLPNWSIRTINFLQCEAPAKKAKRKYPGIKQVQEDNAASAAAPPQSKLAPFERSEMLLHMMRLNPQLWDIVGPKAEVEGAGYRDEEGQRIFGNFAKNTAYCVDRVGYCHRSRQNHFTIHLDGTIKFACYGGMCKNKPTAMLAVDFIKSLFNLPDAPPKGPASHDKATM